MPGTVTNYNVNKTARQPGQIWTNIAIPAPGAGIVLAADGTPDATANPLAKHLGLTEAGSKFTIKPSTEESFADELRTAYQTNITTLEATLNAKLLQVQDFDLLEQITQGIGTRTTGVNFDRITFGINAIAYTSVAVIFPLQEDPTKFGAFLLYKAINTNGIDVNISQKTRGGIEVSFKGFEIPSRAATDTFGQTFRQK